MPSSDTKQKIYLTRPNKKSKPSLATDNMRTFQFVVENTSESEESVGDSSEYSESSEDSNSDSDEDALSSEDEDSSVSSVDTAELNEYEVDEDTTKEINDTIQSDPVVIQYKQDYAKTSSVKTKRAMASYKKKVKTTMLKERAKQLKMEKKYERIFKTRLYTQGKKKQKDLKYFKNSCDSEEKYTLIKRLKEINDAEISDKPCYIQVLDGDTPVNFKACAIHKLNSLRKMDPSNGEYFKIKHWIDGFMRIPFGTYISMPVHISDGVAICSEFMDSAKQTLDDAVYGLAETKMQIMQLLGQFVSNPESTGTSIAIHGDKGVGKTSIVKDGISRILNRPFAFIPLGGATDSSYLEGHSYTYEGSMWGKIAQTLMECKAMNPVIYFDELDKISETPKGAEIANILLHLTDTTQNSEFRDKYFSELHFDVSKCIFIFSYNDETKINPVLKDRMYTIRAKGYSVAEKIVISTKYLLPKIATEVNFETTDIVFTDHILSYIITTYTQSEPGVRNLKRCLEIIFTKLNLCRLMKPGTILYDQNTTIDLVLPCVITEPIVTRLLRSSITSANTSHQMMYI